MRMIPILYSTPMVLAIQANRKTKTRRTKGLEFINKEPNIYNRNNDPIKHRNRIWDSSIEENPNPLKTFHGFRNSISSEVEYVECPYGQVGDILWVRENFYTASNWDHWKPSGLQLVNAEVFYQADIPNYDISRPLSRGKIRPNIFLPFYYARIFLKIKSVTVERLQDITEADAIAEGIEQVGVNMMDRPLYKIYNNNHPDRDGIIYPRWSFCTLWESINGIDSWKLNPWVWVIEFEKVEKPENFN
ncbi:ASCH domain-containing protein [Flavobacterium koreense]